MRSVLFAVGAVALLSGSAHATDLSTATMAQVGAVTEPFTRDAAATANPKIARALEILKREHLAVAPPVLPPNRVADQLGKAMLLGTRTRQFLPELAELYDAVASADIKSIQAAVVKVQQKAGRKAPEGADLDKFVSAAKAALDGQVAPPQHVVIQRPDYTVDIDASPSSGTTKVTVTTPKGPTGQPERVTFSGQQASQPSAGGDALQAITQAHKPRAIDTATADQQRPSLNGDWTDQDGNTWRVAGDSKSITLTGMKGTHPIAYQGEYALGLVNAKHLVNDVLDMDDTLPMDVRQSLASDYHPPFTLKLEYVADRNELSGLWMSGQVTYDAMFHQISLVETPTWDRRLVLRRPTNLKVAQGARYPEEGP